MASIISTINYGSCYIYCKCQRAQGGISFVCLFTIRQGLAVLYTKWRARTMFRTEVCFFRVIIRRFRKTAKKKRLLASSCPYVRMEQLGSHKTDFHEI